MQSMLKAGRAANVSSGAAGAATRQGATGAEVGGQRHQLDRRDDDEQDHRLDRRDRRPVGIGHRAEPLVGRDADRLQQAVDEPCARQHDAPWPPLPQPPRDDRRARQPEREVLDVERVGRHARAIEERTRAARRTWRG